ncbi:conserved hypothetical protein [Sulfolobus islandicus Y.G.57.14]|jgi:hypothetical protein|uniref:Uncharacterized protein n=10 Tax=Saccharolobus islandicus TaxID=43080 RepID=M9UAF4_SACIS|nr:MULTISPECIES: hypothetical protein [Sulfolobaceae]ACP36845.1 conserved hypothetical protein [Sulfolobus islandicus L.S.2.15]ACP39454.1 conserved hypothetical protein [Sulfolobus islandicus M.14.25]ACP47145.1 conserved hypothetical protein [Sulfolobus islandicus Y.G.57.14]ACP49997.1 conserved hypothetical protein [Sulfolobus islandicus Y.N.15.51]ACP56636.1 conserved hypothetical protein [Sulfolobus islandicus M.16.27]
MEPLIAIDLNSNMSISQLESSVKKLFETFGALEVVFIIDDDSIVELDGNLVLTFYTVEDLLETYKVLKRLSEVKSNRLRVTSVIRLERDLKRFPLVVITDRKIIGLKKNLIFVYNGEKVKARY